MGILRRPVRRDTGRVTPKLDTTWGRLLDLRKVDKPASPQAVGRDTPRGILLGMRKGPRTGIEKGGIMGINQGSGTVIGKAMPSALTKDVGWGATRGSL